MDESIEETTANIIKCDYCFPPEHWSGIDERAQSLIRRLLEPTPGRRLVLREALRDPWFEEASSTIISKKDCIIIDPSQCHDFSSVLLNSTKANYNRQAANTTLSAAQLKTFLERRRPSGMGNALHSLRSPTDT